MIAHFTIARIAIPIGVAGLAAVGAARPTGHAPVAKPPRTLAHWALAALALVLIIALAAVCYNHVRFPGYIETMEGVVLQHVQQIVHRQPVYPAVTPAYVPLAYTPGFYYLSAPFVGLFGPSVALLRIIAILGLIVSALVIWMAVRRLTGSAWWALMAVGFFAAAYRVMDSALDNAHADSWLLATALAGTEIIDRATTRRGRLFGMLLLVLAFWFKQHGALFAFGGVLYLTWKFGVRRALPYWTLAILGGSLVSRGGEVALRAGLPLFHVGRAEWVVNAADRNAHTHRDTHGHGVSGVDYRRDWRMCMGGILRADSRECVAHAVCRRRVLGGDGRIGLGLL